MCSIYTIEKLGLDQHRQISLGKNLNTLAKNTLATKIFTSPWFYIRMKRFEPEAKAKADAIENERPWPDDDKDRIPISLLSPHHSIF
ncbi:hypothetical protein HI914_01602 [Erysiphe necator]|nr:hypothetical protein HI914_01602 [Erysiphe necator]